ncbi:MAG TPA: SDR family NAD(P)-dependent oxidoreductase [Pseudonocardia sp.]|jgi:NAD(P)-dependent dehydrogenase (short-subunit alcohol dehydrogenase family)|uniref:SDR family NAD(P)-dependent oxidoreductase n=1 Tax=Pseudonocardia sp. TaxID=60912 RepID=UPI002F3FFDD1
MSGRLHGKVAVVTGAGSGMGAAMAEVFAREGANVVAADISGQQDAVAEKIGRNNAGIDGEVTPTAEYSDEEFDRVLGVNARGVYLGLRYSIPHLLRNGSGAVVNTASMASNVAFPGVSAYCASKGAVQMMTKTAAVEYAGSGIRINAICPGPIRTAITDSLPPDLITKVVNATPLGRYGTPTEVANLALFLASDESSYITGESILIDGGHTAV